MSSSTQQLLNKVGQLAVLPSGSAPSIAMVKNVNELQNQPFFSRAQNGDYVVIYAQSKAAILYRPSINKIVEYASTN